MEKMELRVLPSNLQFASENDDLIVEGLVNRTESWSHELGMRKKFRERVLKGAFNRAIQDSKRIDFLGEHRNDQLLATTENGSLVLWEDEEGLKMRAKISPTSYGKDFYTLMKDGLINHMSFGFRSLSDKWRKLSDGTYERSIEKLALSEVSVVRNPAYPQSMISARGIDLIEEVEIPTEIEECEEKEMDLKEIQESIRSLQEKLDELTKSTVEEEVKEDPTEKVEEETTEETVEETKTEEVETVEETKEDEVEELEKSNNEESVENDNKSVEETEETTTEEVEEERNFMVDIFKKYQELQKYKTL